MSFDKKTKKLKLKQGFSLAEVMLAVFVLAIGIVAAISLISGSMRHSIDSRNEVIASQLAQEGVELVRNIRDNDFDAFFSTFDSPKSYCRIDYQDVSVLDIICTYSTASAPYDLYYNNNYYDHTTVVVNKTRFNRRIAVSYVNDDTRKIYSIVSWDNQYKCVGCGDCTIANHCVYTAPLITKWK